jgi:1-deoxy-D-xylulose-5-phosphate synthase
MAVADAKLGNHRNVVAVIGDGSLSGGLAFEGLNNVSSSPNNLLIILNDNNMSIDRSVGGMKQYLLSLNTNESYNRWRDRVGRWLMGKGYLDDSRRKTVIRLSNAFKSAISQQQNIFEGMNIRYFGPVDGHNIKELVRVIRQLKDMRGPKLLHIHTVKGKGYEPAEKAATIWHAPGRFNPETGERLDKDKRAKYQNVFGETLVELAQANDKIVGITPAMPTGCSMNKLMETMPDRAFDVGIAEGHAATFAGGLAKEGMIPFCNIYSAFAQRAYDNIIHDVAIGNLHVVFCFDRAGIVGEDGATHHGAFDMAALKPVPNLTICAPLNEHELRKMMFTAQLPDQGPWVIRYPRGRGVMDDWRCPLEAIEVGKGRKLKEGKGTAVLSIGHIGNNVAEAVKDTDVAHYDMRFLKPIDTALLDEVGSTYDRVITVEDGVRDGGLGSAVLEYFADKGYTPHVTRIGMPTDTFVEHGTIAELQKLYNMDVEGIKKTLKIKD